MRLYTFVNFYLSSIQQGIQTAHVVHDLFIKYDDDSTCQVAGDVLHDWARNHRTIITLNGGNNESLWDLRSLISRVNYTIPDDDEVTPAAMWDHELPYAFFHEDSQSLNAIMTAVGIVLPREIYDAVDAHRASMLLKSDDLIVGRWYYIDPVTGFLERTYLEGSAATEFLNVMKACPLAR